MIFQLCILRTYKRCLNGKANFGNLFSHHTNANDHYIGVVGSHNAHNKPNSLSHFYSFLFLNFYQVISIQFNSRVKQLKKGLVKTTGKHFDPIVALYVCFYSFIHSFIEEWCVPPLYFPLSPCKQYRAVGTGRAGWAMPFSQVLGRSVKRLAD